MSRICLIHKPLCCMSCYKYQKQTKFCFVFISIMCLIIISGNHIYFDPSSCSLFDVFNCISSSKLSGMVWEWFQLMEFISSHLFISSIYIFFTFASIRTIKYNWLILKLRTSDINKKRMVDVIILWIIMTAVYQNRNNSQWIKSTLRNHPQNYIY